MVATHSQEDASAIASLRCATQSALRKKFVVVQREVRNFFNKAEASN